MLCRSRYCNHCWLGIGSKGFSFRVIGWNFARKRQAFLRRSGNILTVSRHQRARFWSEINKGSGREYSSFYSDYEANILCLKVSDSHLDTKDMVLFPPLTSEAVDKVSIILTFGANNVSFIKIFIT